MVGYNNVGHYLPLYIHDGTYNCSGQYQIESYNNCSIGSDVITPLIDKSI